jgi:hypothetical protein
MANCRSLVIVYIMPQKANSVTSHLPKHLISQGCPSRGLRSDVAFLSRLRHAVMRVHPSRVPSMAQNSPTLTPPRPRKSLESRATLAYDGSEQPFYVEGHCHGATALHGQCRAAYPACAKPIRALIIAPEVAFPCALHAVQCGKTVRGLLTHSDDDLVQLRARAGETCHRVGALGTTSDHRCRHRKGC